jgi:hypothetical protein
VLLERGDQRRDRGGAVLGPRSQPVAVERHLGDARQACNHRRRLGHAVLGEVDVHGIAAELALQLVGAAFGHDPAAIDDRQPRGELIRLLEVVRGEEDRHGLVVGESFDLPPHARARLGVEAGRRLVEEQHLRAVHEAERDVEPPLHPARIRLRRPVRGVGEPEPLQELAHPVAPRSAREPVDHGLHLQVLPPGRICVEARLLAHDADRLADARSIADDVEARRACLAAVGAGEGGQDLDRRRLAGPVRPEQAEDRPDRDAEAEPVEGSHTVPVGLDQIARGDRGLCLRRHWSLLRNLEQCSI